MVFVIDENYLAITAIVTIGWQLLFSIVATTAKSDKVTDLAYGTNFVALAIMTLFLKQTYYGRQIVVTAMVSAWGIRLAGYLFIRVMKTGKDDRFDEIRDSCPKFTVWFILQFILVWINMAPQTILNATDANPEIQALDIVGWILWTLGFICESVADHQKFTYRNNPENKGHWCDVGIWKYSRHPNYAGEIACWWGLFLSCATILSGYTWFSIAGPAILTLILLFGSGVPTTEKAADKRYGDNAEYLEYKARTPVLVPFVPGVFRGIGKVLCCCEWPLYNYLEEKSPLNNV